MLEIKGDFWKHSQDFTGLVCLTNKFVMNNGLLCMGGGIAKGFKDRFYSIDAIWGHRLMDNYEQNVMATIYDFEFNEKMEVSKILIAYPTKYSPSEKSDLKLITTCAYELQKLIDLFDIDVLMGRPGCGLGGLSWDDVKQEIATILDDRCTIISFPEER